ncbi:glutathione S-transferase family protein [Ramlibacter alkalitolerans]|uniref:Glutathione S-transferase family protein n=1 Tax=Ramlibacter alkalitolerans TaxID=2039631 RepID=A0ABS1JQ53_9BURK|nr:glutathione S-transferase family protein [Ramlibacter alkalitolerans]MBL0426394.1 glutathione S-transferase family protein [Ramlibacter alkalitolerans]
MLTLAIGNKNYSSWSMRPWVLMKQAGVPFEERKVRFDNFEADDSQFKQAVLKINPAGRVPVLLDDDFAVWDSLAIAEYVAEKFPDRALWPREQRARARARSVCAEMHSGFTALRSHCGMNIEGPLAEVGRRIWQEQADVRKDVERIVQMWAELLAQHRGPMLFGEFSVADAFYAPVCMRFRTYALPLPAEAEAYVERVCALPAVKAWVADALQEQDFVPFDEPYRKSR